MTGSCIDQSFSSPVLRDVWIPEYQAKFLAESKHERKAATATKTNARGCGMNQSCDGDQLQAAMVAAMATATVSLRATTIWRRVRSESIVARFFMHGMENPDVQRVGNVRCYNNCNERSENTGTVPIGSVRHAYSLREDECRWLHLFRSVTCHLWPGRVGANRTFLFFPPISSSK